jgi:hypothetical protein
MLGWIREKMATQESAPGGGRFLLLVQPLLEMAAWHAVTHVFRTRITEPINQEVEAPPPLGFPHTMLSVKKVKNNMRLTFIEKFFTNREIGMSV